VQAAIDQLGAGLGAEQVDAYREALASNVESPHAALGVMSFLGQHLERATWLYGLGTQAEPGNAMYWNNFGVGLHEKAILVSTVTPDRPLLDTAVASLERAVSLQPDNATFQNNLGFAYLESWRTKDDAKIAQAAVDALRKAVALDPASATAWAHLAVALAISDDVAGAVEAVGKSRAIGPMNGALLAAYPLLTPAVNDELKKKAGGSCAIDYGCKAQCPRSIIGQVNFVTCEVAQSSAQGACEAGRPYAESFDCSEQVPKFGILIPGLNSGFSLVTGYGRIDITVDGQGKIHYKYSSPSESLGKISVSMGAQGTWSPASGFSEVKFKEGFSFKLVGGDVAKQLGDAKLGPGSVNMDIDAETGDVAVAVKAYGGAVLGH
jgi:tetratricopeptide (TPR) repeat protein